MKKIIMLVSLCAISGVLNAQDEEEKEPMKIVKYYFVDLITNPDRLELPKDEVDSIQSAHMANIGQMVKDEILMLAGPFAGGGGIFVLKLETIEEAEELVKKDPAISAGRLIYKIREWYTTANSFVAEEMYKN